MRRPIPQQGRVPDGRGGGYLSPLRKRGMPTLTALESVFYGHPSVPCLTS